MTTIPEIPTQKISGNSSPLSSRVAYVCLLSQYTVATAQAIQKIRPAKVLAITSKFVEEKQSDKRFARLLDSWGIPLTLIGSKDSDHPFVAESLNGSRAWMETQLRPMLKKLKEDGFWLFANLTGATKAASIALNGLWDWDERHYTAEGKSDCINVVGHPSEQEDFSLPPLDLLEEAGLLNDQVKPSKDTWDGFDFAKIMSMVEYIHADYMGGRDQSVLLKNNDLLTAAWFKKNDYKKLLAENDIEATKKYLRFPPGALSDFLAEFACLDPENVCLENGKLRLPADKKSPVVDFIISKWWEILVAHWFRDQGLQVASNVEVKRPETKSSDTESDIVVRLKNGGISVVECKVALPRSREGIDIVKILNDVSKQYGKSRAMLALSPAFWWNFIPKQREEFEQACDLRNIKILQSRDDIVALYTGKEEKRELPPYELLDHESSAKAMLDEAETLIGAWQKEKQDRFQELTEKFKATYPGKKNEIGQLIFKDNECRSLLNKAYRAGRGQSGITLDELLDSAKKSGIPDMARRIRSSHGKGRKAQERFKQQRKKMANGQPLSSVQPRPHTAGKVTLPPRSSRRSKVSTPLPGYHPNDIRGLAPCGSWDLLLDETGDDFIGTSKGNQGRFVGLLVNSDSSELKRLPSSWHAVDEDIDQIDHVVQDILDAQCGIIGLSLATPKERWLDGMLAIVDLVIRLVPLGGPVVINVLIEGRPPFVSGVDAQVAARDALARLGRAWPDRAEKIDLRIKIIPKTGHPLNGYVDALAYTWGSSSLDSRERLEKSELLNTCFLTFDAKAMTGFWDTWDRPGGITAEEWSRLVGSRDAKQRQSLVWHLLFELAVTWGREPARLEPYMAEVRRHLSSKAVNLGLLADQVEWIQSVVQNVSEIPAAMRLGWLTARLARANHMGDTEQQWFDEMERIADRLKQEDSPLVCHAHLHLAVNATNRYDFALAGQVLDVWSDCDPAVPGLRYWGEVQSALGQVAAFGGQTDDAVTYFDKALEAFSRLSDPVDVTRERSQTLCYKLIACMDAEERNDRLVAGLMREYLEIMGLSQDMVAAAKDLAGSVDNRTKYAHHVFLRWLVLGGDERAVAAYLDQRKVWKTGDGHPWPLIQCYRGLLLRQIDQKASRGLVIDAAEAAFTANQGPTVKLIGACCRCLGEVWGESWPDRNNILETLRTDLPLARAHIDRLVAWTNAPDVEPIAVFEEVLPFNFH